MKKTIGCELCGTPAKTYCESDRARLCWRCDAKVHGANFLVAKHSRTLLCHLCQGPTPWSASGPILAPASMSVCLTCLSRGSNTESSCSKFEEEVDQQKAVHFRHNHEDEDNDSESGGSLDDDEHDSSDYDEDEDEEYRSDSDDDEDEDENQVVPWTSTPQQPPSDTAAVGGSGGGESEELNSISISSSTTTSLKRKREIEIEIGYGLQPNHF